MTCKNEIRDTYKRGLGLAVALARVCNHLNLGLITIIGPKI